MARPSATALLLVFVLSLFALAHCRALESDAASDASTTETAAVAVADETGPPNPTTTEAVLPAEQDGFLRLPSHRRHRHPCRHGLFHRHLWWARHHGLLHRHGEPMVKAVAEPDPDRSIRDSDGEVEAVAEPDPDRSIGEVHAVAEPDPDSSLRGGDGSEEDDGAAVKRRWRKEMLWRMFGHGLRHHRHHHHRDEDDHEHEDQGTEGVKRFRHRHHHDDDEKKDEEKEKKMRKLYFHHRHYDEDEDKLRTKPFHRAGDSDDDEDELEEAVRRLRKAILRRQFGRGRRFFRHHWHRHHGVHHHAEASEQADGEQQEGGVMTWIRGLMNRF